MIDIYVTSKRIRDAYKNAGKLSGVDPLLARAIIKIGDRSKDKLVVEDVELSALKMKPSQTTMKPGQSIAMALTMIIKQEVDSDLGAIISSDGYIMDGHHRWAAMILLQGGAAKVGGVRVGLKGSKLVKVLNIVTVGKYGLSGNMGSGNLADFNSERVRELLTGYALNGLRDEVRSWSAEVVQGALRLEYGSVERGIEVMSSNADLIRKTMPSWAVDRVEMPVIDEENVPEVTGMLERGEVDIRPPHYEGAVRVASRYMRRVGVDLSQPQPVNILILSTYGWKVPTQYGTSVQDIRVAEWTLEDGESKAERARPPGLTHSPVLWQFAQEVMSDDTRVWTPEDTKAFYEELESLLPSGAFYGVVVVGPKIRRLKEVTTPFLRRKK